MTNTFIKDYLKNRSDYIRDIGKYTYDYLLEVYPSIKANHTGEYTFAKKSLGNIDPITSNVVSIETFESLKQKRLKEEDQKIKKAIKTRNMNKTEDENIDDAMNDSIYYKNSFYKLPDEFYGSSNDYAIETFFNWDTNGNLCIIKKERNEWKILREKKITSDASSLNGSPE